MRKSKQTNRKISKGYEHGFQKRKYKRFLKCENIYSLRLLGHKLYGEHITLKSYNECHSDAKGTFILPPPLLSKAEFSPASLTREARSLCVWKPWPPFKFRVKSLSFKPCNLWLTGITLLSLRNPPNQPLKAGTVTFLDTFVHSCF